MDTFIEFIKEWGYWAVFLGAIVEGESVILTASALAALDYMNIYKVATIAFFTTLIVDQLTYFVGRYYGPAFFKKFPKMRQKADKAFQLLRRYDTWFILTFRFVYGVRTISPIVIGSAGIPPSRYIPLNFIAAVIWTVVSCYAGYSMGNTIEHLMENVELVKTYVMWGTIILAALVIAYFVFRKRKVEKI